MTLQNAGSADLLDEGSADPPVRWSWLRERVSHRIEIGAGAGLVVVLALASLVRTWGLDSTGYNSDEAVYAGQGASISGHSEYLPYFPIFRAHPLLFQTLVSVVFQFTGVNDLAGRLASVAIGLVTVVLVYLTGRLLYGRATGLIAALIIALMPYHVIVTRQVLLDGSMTLFATLTVYLLAKYAHTGRPSWLYAAGGALGLAFLAKETSVLFLGSIYAFFAIAPAVRVWVRHLAVASLCFVAVCLCYPLSLMFSGKKSTGQSFLAWQLFRRPNHPWYFYFAEVPPAMGLLVVVLAVLGLVLLRRRGSWREALLVCWILVPTVFFTLWATKGFQYLLPTAVPFALLAARAAVVLPTLRPAARAWEPAHLAPYSAGRISRWLEERRLWEQLPSRLRGRGTDAARVGLVLALAVSLLVPTWRQIQPSTTGEFLAGSGGLPGGREAGEWVAANVPEGARLLALGPSMANVIQFYGHRKSYGLSVSPNPLNRNPTYEPVKNPDQWIRNNELQYIVWDSYSAGRSHFFSERLLRYADRYHGRVVHTETVTVRTPDGAETEKPVIIIFEVRP